MSKRITDERLADLKQAHEEFEPFVDNAGDWMKEMHHHRAVLLQAVEAERKKVERLREEQDELGKAYYKMVRLADNLADDKRLLNQEADRKLARLVELPGKWRTDDEVTCYDDCADELEAALKESE